jgi:tetratricopeptide (TPR) repeat protein
MMGKDDPQQMDKGLSKWLKKLSFNRKSSKHHASHYHQASQGELMQRAARCYALAGWNADACRMFVQLGDDRHAAAYFEKLGQYQRAGECYSRVAEWLNAARCFMQCHLKDQAASCYDKAGDRIQASWMWAHDVHHYQKALALVSQIEATSDTDRLFVQLIQARCDAGTARHSHAAKKLHQCIAQLESMPPDMHQHQAYDWCMAIAQHLNRPDLMALIHATALTCHRPNAQENWETWAKDVLGDCQAVQLIQNKAEKKTLPQNN